MRKDKQKCPIYTKMVAALWEQARNFEIKKILIAIPDKEKGVFYENYICKKCLRCDVGKDAKTRDSQERAANFIKDSLFNFNKDVAVKAMLSIFSEPKHEQEKEKIIICHTPNRNHFSKGGPVGSFSGFPPFIPEIKHEKIDMRFLPWNVKEEKTEEKPKSLRRKDVTILREFYFTIQQKYVFCYVKYALKSDKNLKNIKNGFGISICNTDVDEFNYTQGAGMAFFRALNEISVKMRTMNEVVRVKALFENFKKKCKEFTIN